MWNPEPQLPQAKRSKASYLQSLERNAEATAVLEQGIGDFPTSALLHITYSRALWDGRGDVPNECVAHALKAVELDSTNITCIRWGVLVTRAAKNYATSIELGERHLALATAPNDRIDALTAIAEVYFDNELYDDSIRYLKMILTINARDADALARLARCLFMQGKKVEAKQMAKKALMFEPENQLALSFSQ
jgi:tetratricopeptide (TPR) repeat protein